MSASDHHATIVDQFTRQAVPFSSSPGIRDEDALRLLVEASGAGPADTVLDVACGPGLVVAAFARVARHVTGIDLHVDSGTKAAGGMIRWAYDGGGTLPGPMGNTLRKLFG